MDESHNYLYLMDKYLLDSLNQNNRCPSRSCFVTAPRFFLHRGKMLEIYWERQQLLGWRLLAHFMK